MALTSTHPPLINVRNGLHRLAAAAAFVLIAVFAPLVAGACTVAVVKSADLKPYREAIRGFQDTVACDTQEVPLGNDTASDVRALHPDVVFAVGTEAFLGVASLRDLPVVYAMVIPSEAERKTAPNIAGVSMDIAPAEYLAAIQEVFPGLKRVGLVYDPRNTASFATAAAAAAKDAGLALMSVQARGPTEVPGALGRLAGRIDVLWMLPDPTVAAGAMAEYLVRFSIQNNVPIFTFSRKYLAVGAVASLDVDPYAMGAQAGELVNAKVKGGAIPSVSYARPAGLSLNLKIAAKMGVRIGAEARRRARDHE